MWEAANTITRTRGHTEGLAEKVSVAVMMEARRRVCAARCIRTGRECTAKLKIKECGCRLMEITKTTSLTLL